MTDLCPIDPDDLDDFDIDWPDWDEPDPFTEETKQMVEEAEQLGLRQPTQIFVSVKRVPKPTGDDRPLFDGLDDKREGGKKT